MKLRYYIFISTNVLLFFISSCINLNRQLKKEKNKDINVLYSQEIKGNKEVKIDQLEEFYRQKPNRKVFTQRLTPYWAIYVFGEKWYDTTKTVEKKNKIKNNYQEKIAKVTQEILGKEQQLSQTESKTKEYEKITRKISKLHKKEEKLLKNKNKKVDKQELVIKEGNWLMRVVGEPLAVYDSSAHEKTKNQMLLFLNNEGYYQAKVDVHTSIKKQKAKVVYEIYEGPIHTIEKVEYKITDAKINQLITTYQKDKTLLKDNPFKINDLSKERDEIYTLLRNNGYFDFQRQFISFEIDTNEVSLKTHIDVLIANPTKQEKHIQYSIKDIFVLMDINHERYVDTTIYFDEESGKKLHFIHKKGNVKIPKKNLFEIIILKENELYSLEKTRQTQQYLADVDIFKFININYGKSTDSSNTLSAYIYTSSFKKYQLTSEAGVNVNVDEGQGLPGPFFNVKFKDRKVFHGLEVFESNVRYSLQSQLDVTNEGQVISNQIIGANVSLLFPRLFFPSFLINKANLYGYFPRTRMTLGYSENNNPNFDRTLFEFSTNYIFRLNKFSRLNINLLNISILNTKRMSDFFQQYLETLASKGSTMNQSFKSGIITSSQISYSINSYDLSKNVKGKYYRFLGEVGYSLLKNGELFGLPHYQYIKLNADIRHYVPISKQGTFAFRVNTGIIQMYGLTNTLPFEKYFFIGGVNSIRAWQIRRLGPGAYSQAEQGTLFQQPGDLIFESSFEVRRKLGGFVNGALFLDVGNIWTLKSEAARPNSAFNISNFYNTIAVGSGAGLRFDFSFLIIRFDLGVKVWDPAEQQWVIKNYKKDIYNLGFGIGYPF